MMQRGIAALAALLFLAVVPVGPPLAAQDQPAITKQEMARTKFRDLTERMQKLMLVLQKNDTDANAAIYWLTRMLEAGEDRRYLLRRLIRMAIEDVGLAETNIVMGKHSGRAALRSKLKELGFDLADNQLNDIFVPYWHHRFHRADKPLLLFFSFRKIGCENFNGNFDILFGIEGSKHHSRIPFGHDLIKSKSR